MVIAFTIKYIERFSCHSKRFQSLTGQESFGSLGSGAVSNGLGNSSLPAVQSASGPVTAADLESLRQEVLSDMRSELHKFKQELLDGTVIFDADSLQ